jgi:hypothetical protein
VQLEVGAVATPFEFKPFAQDLQECQRYYWKISADQYSNHGLGLGSGGGGTNPGIRRLSTPLPVPMRARPTITKNGTHQLLDAAIANIVFNSINANLSSNVLVALDVNTTSTAVTHRPYMWIMDSSSSSDSLEASAEL